MNRKDFIQRFVITHCPPPAGANPIHFAETLWAKLSARGFGHKAHKPQDLKTDCYEQLIDNAKARFDQFWAAFAYKKARNNAAMKWGQMEAKGISKNEFEQILLAAKKEAEQRVKLPKGAVPIMAQGWLNQMRWKDVILPGKKEQASDEKRKKEREIKANIQHFETQYKLTNDVLWKKQADEARKQLEEVKQ